MMKTEIEKKIVERLILRLPEMMVRSIFFLTRFCCPTARVVGYGYVEDYELTFRLHVTIEKAKGKKVPVIVWKINDD